jgi:hypothetical protein
MKKGVGLPTCKWTSNKSIRMIQRLLNAGEHCTLRVCVDKQQSQRHKQELSIDLRTTLIAPAVKESPSTPKAQLIPVSQSEEEILGTSLLERLSVVEDTITKTRSLTEESREINVSSFEICINNEHPNHSSRLGFESGQNSMDAFEEKFGLTRLMQAVESIGFQIFDSVKMLNALTGGQCNTPVTTAEDLAEASSSEELWCNDGNSIRMSARNNSTGSYSVENQIDPCDIAKHFQGGAGTLIADRYIIKRDLGIGAFGRVVACVDTHQQHKNEFERRVAIKIVRNDVKDIQAALMEADILRHINSHSDRRGTSLCVAMPNQFYFMDRRHYCLMFESLGLSLYDFMKNHDFALEFLNSIKLIHTGLKPENILL